MDEIYNEMAAAKMGIEEKGQVRGTSHLMSSDLMTSPPPHTHTHTHTQVCIMIHSGSRGLGHQVATGQWVSCDVHVTCAAMCTVSTYTYHVCMCTMCGVGVPYLRLLCGCAHANFEWSGIFWLSS